MSNKQTLLKGKPQYIVAGLVLSVLLALLVIGAALPLVSQNGPSPDGTRVTVVSPSGDRDGSYQPGDTSW